MIIDLLIILTVFSVLTSIGVWTIYWTRKPGFQVLDAFIIKTKNALPILSLTISFKGTPVSYLNPMLYIKSKSDLYKATIFSGSSIKEMDERIHMLNETPQEIRVEKILPYRLGIFTINVFYPTEIYPYNKTYLYVTQKHGKVKKIRLKYKLK